MRQPGRSWSVLHFHYFPTVWTSSPRRQGSDQGRRRQNYGQDFSKRKTYYARPVTVEPSHLCQVSNMCAVILNMTSHTARLISVPHPAPVHIMRVLWPKSPGSSFCLFLGMGDRVRRLFSVFLLDNDPQNKVPRHLHPPRCCAYPSLLRWHSVFFFSFLMWHNR